VTAAIAVAAPLMALPYHLGQISYNTMPILGLVLGTAAGFAAILRRDRRWAFVCGAAVAVGVLSFPLIVVGGVILLVAVLAMSRRREVVASVVLGGLAVSVPFGLWLLVGVGPSLVAETLRFTLDYQALRLPVEQRGRLALDAYTFHLGLRMYWPMWGAALFAALPMLPIRARAAAVATVPPLRRYPSGLAVVTSSRCASRRGSRSLRRRNVAGSCHSLLSGPVGGRAFVCATCAPCRVSAGQGPILGRVSSATTEREG
jgi:hypothetical protein